MDWIRNKAGALLKVLVLVGVFSGPGSAFSQENGAGLNREKWEQERGAYDYGEVKQKEPEPDLELPDFEIDRDREGWHINETLRNVILIVLALGLLAFLVNAFLIAPSKRNASVESLNYAVEILEENLPDADVDPLLRQALEQGEYALVIRLRYLRILQLLDGQGAIVWKREKTNRTYLEEMRVHASFSEFEQLTKLFEAIRYGDRPLNIADYERIAPRFVQFINKLML